MHAVFAPSYCGTEPQIGPRLLLKFFVGSWYSGLLMCSVALRESDAHYSNEQRGGEQILPCPDDVRPPWN